MKRMIFAITLISATLSFGQNPKPPTMGWSSWNNFGLNINQEIIEKQADALVSSGLYKAGYHFINIDDGFWGGRDASGHLLIDKSKFPNGLKPVVDYIHSKGLLAGIYSDAGADTCGSIWEGDKNGIGSGLYGHEQQDLDFFFKDLKFDFIKVDWCGGKKLGLDEKTQYTKIIDITKEINPNIVFNICRWEFPGIWAIKLADSWRISEDITPDFNKVLKIIEINSDLGKYESPGHYNDMDMLEVGRGMTNDEDKSHFSMWCMLNSPLMLGNDLRNMSKQTLDILTNKELIALNQDKAFKQATRIFKNGTIQIWEKPLSNGKKAFAILNTGEANKIQFTSDELKLSANVKIRDLWEHQNLGKFGKDRTFTIAKHGIIVLKTE